MKYFHCGKNPNYYPVGGYSAISHFAYRVPFTTRGCLVFHNCDKEQVLPEQLTSSSSPPLLWYPIIQGVQLQFSPSPSNNDLLSRNPGFPASTSGLATCTYNILKSDPGKSERIIFFSIGIIVLHFHSCSENLHILEWRWQSTLQQKRGQKCNVYLEQ